MTSFLFDTLKFIESKHSSWSEVVIVLPSKRAKVFLIDHLIKLTNKAQLAPQIFSIEEFVAHLSHLNKAPGVHLLFSLYEVYTNVIEKKQQETFEEFLQWAPRLIKDFNDIDAYRLEAQNALSNLGEFYLIEAINKEDNTSSFSSDFWTALPKLFYEFQTHLIAKEWGTMGMLYREALDTLQIYLDQTTHQHYFVGFNALNTSEEYLFQEFLNAEKGTALWDLDKHFYDDSSHASGRFIRKYQNEWNYYRKAPSSFISSSFSSPKSICAKGFSGVIPQAQHVGEIVAQHLKEGDQPAIILGDESLLLPVLAHLPEDLKDWNVTMGYPIEQLPVTRFMLDFIALHALEDPQGLERKKVTDLFKYAPIRKMLKKESAAAAEELKRMTHHYSWSCSSESISRIKECRLGLTILTQPKKALALLEQCLTLVDYLKRNVDATEQSPLFSAVLEKLKQLFHQTKVQLEGTTMAITNQALYLLIKEALQLQTLDFKGEPTRGIQIMGMLETRTLDFETIIITHVNEGILPVGKNDQSFFPFALKKHYGLPTYLDNDAIYSYHFYRLLQRAKNIYLLYNANSEGLNAGEKSRFIRSLAFNQHPNHYFSDESDVKPIPSFVEEVPAVKKNKAIIERIQRLAQNGFSPTSLGMYLLDPMAFYNRYVLGIKEVIEDQKVLTHFKRGEIVHDTLEALYAPFIGQPMEVEFYKKMLSELPQLFTHNFQLAYSNETPLVGENHLIISAYQRAVDQFLRHEMELVKAGNRLTVLALEKPFKVPIAVFDSSRPVFIGGKIDRIDRYNKQLRFIDYKTGTVEKSQLYWNDWDIFKGDYKRQPLFQVLLYAWSQHQEYLMELPFQAGIISLKNPKSDLISLQRKNLPKTDNLSHIDRAFIDDIETFLKDLIKEIFDEQNSFVSLK
ncbi:MAG: PD-(D/E)XK nuclease family protein [Flavobacteriaceae bacterium]